MLNLSTGIQRTRWYAAGGHVQCTPPAETVRAAKGASVGAGLAEKALIDSVVQAFCSFVAKEPAEPGRLAVLDWVQS